MKEIEKHIREVCTSHKFRIVIGAIFLVAAFIITLLKKDAEIPFIYNQF